MVDADLRPWLIEVNASPSLSATTSSDRIMKHQLISDVLEVVIPDQFPEVKEGAKGGVDTGIGKHLENWTLLQEDVKVVGLGDGSKSGVKGPFKKDVRPDSVMRKAFY